MAKLEKPRTAWVMVPAGEITDKTITALAEVLEPGDTIIDGGNTSFHDDLRHAAALEEKESITSTWGRAAACGGSSAASA